MNQQMYLQTKVYPSVGAGITTNTIDFGGSTGVCCVMNFGTEVEIQRWGLTVDDNELLDVGAGMVLALKKYLVPGSSTNAVTIGSISTGTTDVAKGSGLYQNLVDLDVAAAQSVAVDGSTVTTAPAPTVDTRTILPGQQLVFDLPDAADTSGKGSVWVQYIEKPFVASKYSNFTEVAY